MLQNCIRYHACTSHSTWCACDINASFRARRGVAAVRVYFWFCFPSNSMSASVYTRTRDLCEEYNTLSMYHACCRPFAGAPENVRAVLPRAHAFMLLERNQNQQYCWFCFPSNSVSASVCTRTHDLCEEYNTLSMYQKRTRRTTARAHAFTLFEGNQYQYC